MQTTFQASLRRHAIAEYLNTTHSMHNLVHYCSEQYSHLQHGLLLHQNVLRAHASLQQRPAPAARQSESEQDVCQAGGASMRSLPLHQMWQGQFEMQSDKADKHRVFFHTGLHEL